MLLLYGSLACSLSSPAARSSSSPCCPRYVKADYTLDQEAFCRAYINFVNQEDIYIFQVFCLL